MWGKNEKIYYSTKWEYRQVSHNYWIVTDKDWVEYFVFKFDRLSAFSGDIVEISVKKLEEWNKKAEAIIDKIIKRSENDIIWIFQQSKRWDFGFVRAYNTFGWKDIFVHKVDYNWAKDGDVVIVNIKKWLDKPSWFIKRSIGKKDDNDIQEKIILMQNNINKHFPQDIIKEVNDLKQISNLEKRLDLREEIIVTIDWADAKDLDDAIGVKRLSDWNWELWVHIADVAEYVREWTDLDFEAKKRWTSVYIPWEVIPMLPEKISNDLCSLNTNWYKATLSIILVIDGKNWKVISKNIFESVITNKARLTYDEVEEVIKNWKSKIENSDNNWIFLDKEIIEMLLDAHELYKLIYKRRKKEGKIEFEFDELKVEIGKDWKVKKVYKRERNTAHKVIEEFMVMANEEVSRFFSLKKIPFLYRTHEKPSEENILGLQKTLQEYWILVDPKAINPLFLSQILDNLKWNKFEKKIAREILLSMSKAKYEEKPLGHFGLSLDYYSHFTSPIRRYPDLQIHRIIKEFLNGKLNNSRLEHYKKILPNIGIISSQTEQKAEEIERKITFLKTIEYMQNFIWENFSWEISWLTNYWIYVMLDNWIEWLVNNRTFTDNMIFLEDKKVYSEVNWNKCYELWQKVEIKVLKANKSLGFLDFELV